MDTVIEVIGQALGIIAVILGFISFQMKSSKGILAFQIITALVFSAHYLLIGAKTAVALNFAAAVQDVFYYFRNKRGSKSIAEPIFFTALMIALSILTWESWYSVFIMLGLAVISVSFSFTDPNKIRASMFIKSPLCLVYNILVISGGGIIYECAVLASSVIGIIRSKKSASQN